MTTTNTTINRCAVDNGPKATKAKRASVIHFYERPDGVRCVDHVHYLSLAEAKAALEATK